MEPSERQFSFERLIAWQYALDALAGADAIANAFPRPYGELADQLRARQISSGAI